MRTKVFRRYICVQVQRGRDRSELTNILQGTSNAERYGGVPTIPRQYRYVTLHALSQRAT